MNAKAGVEARNALASAILAQIGDTCTAAFRFGFNLVNLMPQLEFLQTAQENPSTTTPPEELLGPLANQFDALVSDGELLGLSQAQLARIRGIHTRAVNGNAGDAGDQLIGIGSKIDADFKSAFT
jgi:hypothetical protein